MVGRPWASFIGWRLYCRPLILTGQGQPQEAALCRCPGSPVSLSATAVARPCRREAGGWIRNQRRGCARPASKDGLDVSPSRPDGLKPAPSGFSKRLICSLWLANVSAPPEPGPWPVRRPSPTLWHHELRHGTASQGPARRTVSPQDRQPHAGVSLQLGPTAAPTWNHQGRFRALPTGSVDQNHHRFHHATARVYRQPNQSRGVSILAFHAASLCPSQWSISPSDEALCAPNERLCLIWGSYPGVTADLASHAAPRTPPSAPYRARTKRVRGSVTSAHPRHN